VKILDKALAAVIKAVIWLFRFIPYDCAIGIGRGLAAIAYVFAPQERRTAEIQMKAALGDRYKPTMAIKVFLNHADVFVDAIRYAYMDDKDVKKRITITGIENLKAAQASGRGLMMICTHAGNWEVLGNVARMLQMEVCVMADLRDNSDIERLINDIRRKTGVTILPPTGKLLMLVRELKRGRAIAFIIDKRGEKGTDLYCNFFGMPALTNPAPAFIAIKGDALIVPYYSTREGYSYKVTICPAVDTRTFSGDAIQSISDYMHAWTEEVIRKNPERWTWTYSRWIRRSEMKEVIKNGLDFKEYVRSKTDKEANGR
jgi:Kdo2-lipid IVA lauroyltransferase/acyltransferase